MNGHAVVDDMVRETMLRALDGLTGLEDPARFPAVSATEVIPVVWTHLTMDLDGPGRCRSTWQGPRSTVRSSGPTRSRCGGLRPAGGRSRTSRPI
ncbi:hypothetical protein SLUN_00610 [Streptomyces lunaelactis]|uniref:Uncharacterized protein n=1 Tax=Streptomyces lunaelactis TaxID=1535768 RepID=A0A2R4SVV8_9ACTN|nr:hypothetical protein SLUN_00610 [Streptomyces lunaelactis]